MAEYVVNVDADPERWHRWPQGIHERIVRCRDCVYRDGFGICRNAMFWGSCVEADGFCHNGKQGRGDEWWKKE